MTEKLRLRFVLSPAPQPNQNTTILAGLKR